MFVLRFFLSGWLAEGCNIECKDMLMEGVNRFLRIPSRRDSSPLRLIDLG